MNTNRTQDGPGNRRVDPGPIPRTAEGEHMKTWAMLQWPDLECWIEEGDEA